MARKKSLLEVSDNQEQKVYGPCSDKQKLVLTEDEVDILLIGGG